MIFALVDDENKIVNMIVYNGSDAYDPPEGLRLVEVDDTKKIGDQVSE